MRSKIGSLPAPLAQLGLILALLSCSGEAAIGNSNGSAGAAEAPKSMSVGPPHPSPLSDPRSALAAIRTQWAHCRDEGSGPPSMQECDDRAIQASNALLSRSAASSRLEALEGDLFEPLVDVSVARGEDAVMTQVYVIYSDAKLAQRRAAILTGVSREQLGNERVRYSLLNLLLRVANRRSRVLRELMGSRPAQSWLRRWLAIRDEDCAAYPVRRCAKLLDGAFRAMLYDNLSDEGERRLPSSHR